MLIWGWTNPRLIFWNICCFMFIFRKADGFILTFVCLFVCLNLPSSDILKMSRMQDSLTSVCVWSVSGWWRSSLMWVCVFRSGCSLVFLSCCWWVFNELKNILTKCAGFIVTDVYSFYSICHLINDSGQLGLITAVLFDLMLFITNPSTCCSNHECKLKTTHGRQRKFLIELETLNNNPIINSI